MESAIAYCDSTAERRAVNSLFEIPSRYADLDAKMRASQGKVFISDWNGTHPFVSQYLGPLAQSCHLQADVTSYALPEDDSALLERIGSLHGVFEDLNLTKEEILVGDGSTSLLSTFCFWLAINEVKEVFYLPPLFWSIANMFKMLRLCPFSVSREHAFQAGFRMRLPERKCVLMLSDPVWYAGKRLTEEQILQLRQWQEATGSIIFVDGTFQYMQWDGERGERAAGLSKEHTFRLVCPTKHLSIHGFRFAYLLQPTAFHEEVTNIYDSVHGASSQANLMFAHRALDVMCGPDNNKRMVEYAKENYLRLVESGSLREHVEPECGYYVFGRPSAPASEFVAMDQSHFELEGFPDYVRINLLNPGAMELLTH